MNILQVPQPQPGEREINLKQLFSVIRRRLWIVIILSVLGAVAGGLYSIKPVTPVYQVTTRVLIKAEPEIMNTLKVMVREPSILDKVIKALELNRSSADLRENILVTTVDNSFVLIIAVQDPDPYLAAKIANNVVVQYRQEVAEVMNFTHISVLSEAKVSDHPVPVNQRGKTAVIYGFIAGAAAALGLVFFLDSLDDTIKTKREAEQWLDLPVLGYVSKISRKDSVGKKPVALRQPLRGETIGS